MSPLTRPVKGRGRSRIDKRASPITNTRAPSQMKTRRCSCVCLARPRGAASSSRHAGHLAKWSAVHCQRLAAPEAAPIRGFRSIKHQRLAPRCSSRPACRREWAARERISSGAGGRSGRLTVSDGRFFQLAAKISRAFHLFHLTTVARNPRTRHRCVRAAGRRVTRTLKPVTTHHRGRDLCAPGASYGNFNTSKFVRARLARSEACLAPRRARKKPIVGPGGHDDGDGEDHRRRGGAYRAAGRECAEIWTLVAAHSSE